VLFRSQRSGFEILSDIVKKTIEIITMDKEIIVEPDKEKCRIAVYGKDLAIVIGKNGMGMDALEYLVNLIGKRKKLVDKNVVLDIKDYRKKNDEKLKEIAINMAKKALKERKTIALRPMPSHERKIVHNILSKVKNIRTKSRDDEPNRRIVIYPVIKE
jgi:spoIIIJ-associated protein